MACFVHFTELLAISIFAFACTVYPFFIALLLHLFPVQKLQEQDERAEQLKDRLRWEQQELRVRLEQLQRGTERMRNDSQGSTMSSERSDSDRGKPLGFFLFHVQIISVLLGAGCLLKGKLQVQA